MTLTEKQRPGEFLVSEGPGNYSREVLTLESGQTVVDGQVMMRASATKMVALDYGTETLTEAADIIGIVLGDWDSSPTGTNADISGVPYIARLAEVDGSLLTYPDESSEGGEEAAVVAALLALGIVVR